MMMDVHSAASLVKSFDSVPRSLTALGDRLVFIILDFQSWWLWISDGTDPGTKAVKFLYDVQNGCDACPPLLTAVGDRLFFSAYDPEHGFELWVSDGTDSGTHLVKDIYPGPGGSEPSNLTAIGDRLFFAATDPEHGDEVWVSDGTEAGTILYAEVVPGSGGSAPGGFIAMGELLFFAAENPEYGRELWVVPIELVPHGGLVIPGDANDDASLDISDAVATLGFLFLGSPTKLPCGDGSATDPANLKLLDW